MDNELDIVLSSLDSQAESYKGDIESRYQSQDARLSNEESRLELDRQAALGDIRLRERREQRKADLPLSTPKPLNTVAKIEDIERWHSDARAKIAGARNELRVARDRAYQELTKNVAKAKEQSIKEYNRLLELQRERMITITEPDRAQQSALDNLSSYKESDGYNLTAAIQAGKLADVERAGFDAADIARAQLVIEETNSRNDSLKRLDKYTNNGKNYDLASAIKDGYIDDIRNSKMFDPLDIVDAQLKAVDIGIAKHTNYLLAPYEAETGGHYLAKAINAGIDNSVLRLAGYTDEQIAEAKAQLKAISESVKSTIEPIKPPSVKVVITKKPDLALTSDTMTAQLKMGEMPSQPIDIGDAVLDWIKRPFTEQDRIVNLSQAELKSLYKEQENAPILKKILTTKGFTVTYDIRKDRYTPVIHAGIPMTAASPSAILSTGELIAIIAGLALAGGSVYVSQNKEAVRDAIESFRDTFGRNPRLDEIQVIEEPVSGAISEFKLVPPVSPTVETFPASMPSEAFSIPAFPLAQETGASFTLSPITAPKIKESYTTSPISAPELPKAVGTTLLRPTALEGYMIASTGVATIPINWNKLLNEVNRKSIENVPIGVTSPVFVQGVRAGSIQALDSKIYDMFTSQQISGEQLAEYKQARQRYMERQGLSEDTIQQSSNQTLGSVNFDEIAASALSLLINVGDIDLTESEINSIVNDATKAGNEAAQRAINQSLDASETNSLVRNAVNVTIQTKTQQLAKTKTAAQTKTMTQARTLARTRPLTRELVRDMAKEATESMSIKPFALPALGTESDSSTIKAGMQPSIFWKQGFVYWIIDYPYKQGNIRCSKTAPINGQEVDGMGSAYKSIQALGGDANVVLTVDMGIMDVEINKPSERAGKRGSIKFKRDKYDMNQSNITVKGVRL